MVTTQVSNLSILPLMLWSMVHLFCFNSADLDSYIYTHSRLTWYLSYDYLSVYILLYTSKKYYTLEEVSAVWLSLLWTCCCPSNLINYYQKNKRKKKFLIEISMHELLKKKKNPIFESAVAGGKKCSDLAASWQVERRIYKVKWSEVT